MVNYVKTTNGYFYKICKSAKKRISEDEYNKQIKIKKMMGGMLTITNTTTERTRSLTTKPELMENVFKTGPIIDSNGTKSSTVTRIKKSLMELLNKIKSNIELNSNNAVNIAYLGQIEYTGSGHIRCNGTSNIWIEVNIMTGKVNYIVEINRKDDNCYENHVLCALTTLSDEKCEWVITALQKLGVDLSKLKNYNPELNREAAIHRIAEIDDEIQSLKKRLKDLDYQKTNIQLSLYVVCSKFNWSFSINN
jgi:hypothetical protein